MTTTTIPWRFHPSPAAAAAGSSSSDPDGSIPSPTTTTTTTTTTATKHQDRKYSMKDVVTKQQQQLKQQQLKQQTSVDDTSDTNRLLFERRQERHVKRLGGRKENKHKQQHQPQAAATLPPPPLPPPQSPTTPAESNGLFRFPWHWDPLSPTTTTAREEPLERDNDSYNNKNMEDQLGRHSGKEQQCQREHGKFMASDHYKQQPVQQPPPLVWDDTTTTSVLDKGVPSVVFAIDNDDCPSALDESVKRFQEYQRRQKREIERRRRTANIKSNSSGSRRKRTDTTESLALHCHSRKPNKHHITSMRRYNLPEEGAPITPSPHVPVMVGNKDDPILCSQSLAGSVHRHFSTGQQQQSQSQPYNQQQYKHRLYDDDKKKRFQKHHNRLKQLRKQTIHDLTALESVSTYDLQQRYQASEVYNIFHSSTPSMTTNNDRKKSNIALPRLCSPPPPSQLPSSQPLLLSRS